MSSTIDERVVEMRFDNKQFESGAKETMSTLEKLKTALSFTDSSNALDGLEEAANNVDLSGLSASLEALQNRFSLFGTFTSRIVENLADTLYNKVGSAISYVTGKIKTGGYTRAQNIENARFQLQSVLQDEEKVQEIMDQAMKSVDGTAYAFDVAAKAASQFTASGIQAGDQLQNALDGMAGVAATFSTDYESLSSIYVKIAGQGRMMGDELNQLSNRGINAAATIADYINAVNDGTASASATTLERINEISAGAKVTESDIRSAVSDSMISFDLFSEAMNSAFGDAAQKANETFTGSLANLGSAFARIGAEFYSPLIAQNSELVRLFNALRVQVNQVKKSISYDETIGNSYALIKRLTDFILARAGEIADFFENTNFTKPITVGIAVVETFLNVLKGLYSIIKPIGQAFSEVFLTSGVMDEIVTASADLYKLTQNMKLSETSSNNLKDAAKGVFDVLKLIVDIIGDLLGVSTSMLNPAGSLLDLFISILGVLGRGTSTLVDWIRNSEVLQFIFDGVSTAFRDFMNWIAGATDKASEFVNHLKEMESVQRLTDKINELGTALEKWIMDRLPGLGDDLDGIFNTIDKFVSSGVDKIIDFVANSLADLIDIVMNFKASDITAGLDGIESNLGKIKAFFTGNESINNYLKNMYDYFVKMKNTFTFDNLVTGLTKLQEKFEKFIDFIKGIPNAIAPIFSDVTFGGLIATGSGVALLKTLNQFSSALNGVTSTIKSTFSKLGGALTQWQKKLKAETMEAYASAIKKVAEAILILAAALILLSFADMSKVMQAAVVLALLGSIIIAALTVFEQIKTKAKTAEPALSYLTKGLGKAANNFANSFKWKTIGAAFLEFAAAIVIIAGAIVAIGYVYQQHPDLIKNGGIIVGTIVAALLIIISLMSALGQKIAKGMKAFSSVLAGVLAVSVALNLIVLAVKSMFSLEVPSDYNKQMDILKDIFKYMAALILVEAVAARIAGGNKAISAPLISAAAAIYIVVLAIDKLFKMDLSSNYDERMNILKDIFIYMGALIVAVGVAGALAGGKLKAAGTILSFAALLVVVVGALMILCMMPYESLIKGATSLAIVFAAIAVALVAAGTIKTKDAYKSIIALGIILAEIVIAFGVLSLISWSNILKSVVSLSAVLISLGYAFKQAAKMTNENTYKSLAVMTAIIGEIAIALFVLAYQPWSNMLASAAAMSAVLLSFAYTLKQISKSSGLKAEKINQILKASVLMIVVAGSLYLLSEQPWSGMLASAVAMSAVLLAFSEAMKKISAASGIESDKINQLLKASVAMIVIAGSLWLMSQQPWQNMLASAAAMSAVLLVFSKCLTNISEAKFETGSLIALGEGIAALAAIAITLYVLADPSLSWENMLAAAVAMSAVLLAMSATLKIASSTKFDITTILAFIPAIAAIVAIAWSLKTLADSSLSWENMLVATVSISALLLTMSGVMAICSRIGPVALEALAGLVILDVFIADLIALIALIGFAFEKIEGSEESLTKGIEILVKIGEGLGEFVGAIVKGLLEEISSALPIIGQKLSDFWTNASVFFDGISALPDGVALKAAALAGAIIALTVADFISGIESLLPISGGLITMGQNLTDFWIAALPFFLGLSALDPTLVDAAGTLADLILKLTVADLITGITNLIGIGGNLSSFGTDLGYLGDGLAVFAEKTAGIDATSVQGAAAAVEILANLATKLPGEGGWIQTIFGEKDLGSFGDQLKILGPALAQFAADTAEINAESVQGAADAAAILVELKDSLPEEDGWMQSIFGEKSLSSFGDQLGILGPALAQFAEDTKDITAASVQGASDALSILITLQNSIDATGGLMDLFAGKSDLGTFGTNLASFGSSFKTFYDYISDVDSNKLTATVKSLDSLVSFANQVATVDVEPMVNFVTGMQAFGDSSINAFVEAFSGSKAKAQVAVSTVCKEATTAATNGFSGLQGKLKQIGSNAIIGLTQGMLSQTSNVTKVTKQLANTVNTTFCNTLEIESPSKVMMQNGKYIDQGLANGIDKNSKSVVKSTNKMASSVEDEVRDVLEIHSPSEILKKLGYNISEGLAKGIDSGKTSVVKVCQDLGIDATTAVKNGLGSWDDWLGSDSSYVKAFTEQMLGYESDLVDGTEDTVDSITDVEEDSVKSAETTAKAKSEIASDAIKVEEDYWERLLKIKQEGADAEKYADMDLEKFKESILSDATDIYQNYLDEWESATDEIAKSLSLFDEVEDQEAKTKDEIVKNLQDQIKAIDEYAYVMASLDDRLAGTDLLEYLQTLGVDSTEQLKVINSMTDEELTNYANLYDTKLASANIAAAAQLTTLRTDTEQQLNELFGSINTSVNLVDFGAMFDGTIESLTSYVEQFIEPFENATTDIQEAATGLGEAALEGITEGISEIDSDTIVEPITDAITNADTSDLKEAGGYMVEGIGEGMTDSTAGIDAATQVVDDILDAVQSEGEIQSPSQLMAREVGPYITEGIGVGMVDGLESLGSYVSEVMTGIIDLYNSELETQDFTEIGTSITTSIQTAIETEYPNFKISGNTIVENIISGITLQYPTLYTSGTEITKQLISAIDLQLPNFKLKGTAIIQQILSAIYDKYPILVTTGQTISNKILEGISSCYNAMYQAGANATMGFVDGMMSKIQDAANAAAEIARAAYESAMSALDEHSPSKKMKQVGAYAGVGFVNGLMNYVAKAANAGEELGSNTLNAVADASDGIQNVLDWDLITDPVIKPTVDMSSLTTSISDINKMFNEAIHLNADLAQSAAVTSRTTTDDTETKQTQKETDTSDNNYNFIQNITSPKALSRVEIYRQTRNQLIQFKEATSTS
jgi:hypothetical protein